MENIGEKIAYLKGLAEGLNVGESTNEGKIISGILDVLAELNEYIVEIDDDLALVQEEMDNMSDDLADVEDVVFEDDDDCDCDCCDDDDMYEITCPHCGEAVFVDGETLETEDIYCPSCREMIPLDLPDGCDCGCDCDCDCED